MATTWEGLGEGYKNVGGSQDTAYRQAEWNKLFTQNPYGTPQNWGGWGVPGNPQNAIDRGWSYSGPAWEGTNTIGDPLGGISTWYGGDFTAQGGMGTYGWKPGREDPDYGGVYQTLPEIPTWFHEMFTDEHKVPFERGYSPTDPTMSQKIMGERMEGQRAGPGGTQGQTDPWRELMKGGVVSANPSADIYSSREDIARSAYNQLSQLGQLGQFADAPWAKEFASQTAGPGGEVQAPTAWGTQEAVSGRQQEAMQSEAARIAGQQGFASGVPASQGVAATNPGLEEFYGQFPWMKGESWEQENVNFNELVNQDRWDIPSGQEDPSYTTVGSGGVPGGGQYVAPTSQPSSIYNAINNNVMGQWGDPANYLSGGYPSVQNLQQQGYTNIYDYLKSDEFGWTQGG